MAIAHIHSDFIVVGSGIAALRAAVELAAAGEVLVLTKADRAEGNTGYAQGGIAAAVGDEDSSELHASDTLAAGDGLCDPAAVRVLVEEGPAYVRELVGWGARFDRDGEGRLALAREGAHSVRRVLHAKDATGREIGITLWRRASEHGRIRVVDHALVVDLMLTDGACAGVHFVDEGGELQVARARATLLATGGAGQVFRETTNPPVATGDGIAIAFRAGAEVMDLEFVQFHPTALKVPGAPRFLLSEALRGEGARLVNAAGEHFMGRYEAGADLASRDRVARAIVREEERTGGRVCLSLETLPRDYVHRRFPLIAAACAEVGFDLATDPVPVGPAAHYVMGGVATDLDGRTSVPGLYAAGEVACTGVHGANRLASNSLLEGLVFGARAGRTMREAAGRRSDGGHDRHAPRESPPDPAAAVAEVQDIMWRLVGLFREADGLRQATARLEAIAASFDGLCTPDREVQRARSVGTVGRLMARAALRREESRGAHYRADFPERNDLHWKRHVKERRDE